MSFVVHKVPLASVTDASGLARLLDDGSFVAERVVAIIGKTEGNGGINDFTRILADRAHRDVLLRRGVPADRVAAIPMVWSGGTDGVLCPHATIFARDERPGPGTDELRLTVGTAMSDPILPEEIGRPGMVAKVAEGVRRAMRDAGIDDPRDVHLVQTKTPLLTMESIQEATLRGATVAARPEGSMDLSNGTAALGIGVALGELDMPSADAIGRDLELCSSVASCSSGVELDQAQIIVLGNRRGIGGRFRAGHGVMRDALALDEVYAAIRSAGLGLPPRPRAEDLGARVVNVFVKCEADPSATLRGRRQVALNDSDVHHHRHLKAAVGAVVAAALGDPAVFVSVGAMHQGPPGGGPIAAIVDLS